MSAPRIDPSDDGTHGMELGVGMSTAFGNRVSSGPSARIVIGWRVLRQFARNDAIPSTVASNSSRDHCRQASEEDVILAEERMAQVRNADGNFFIFYFVPSWSLARCRGSPRNVSRISLPSTLLAARFDAFRPRVPRIPLEVIGKGLMGSQCARYSFWVGVELAVDFAWSLYAANGWNT